MSFNKIIIIGNLGRDPELRYTPQGDAVCNFSVAVNEKRRDKTGEFQDITTWFRITLWRKLAENASKYLTKGSPVYIEGKLHVEEWTDRDGNNRHTLEVTATEMQFLSGKQNDSESNFHNQDHESDNFRTTPVKTESSPKQTQQEDDIPF